MVPPRYVAPSKNATFVTLPSVSLAVAVIGTLAGEVKEAPSVGEAMATVGDTLPEDALIVARKSRHPAHPRR